MDVSKKIVESIPAIRRAFYDHVDFRNALIQESGVSQSQCYRWMLKPTQIKVSNFVKILALAERWKIV